MILKCPNCGNNMKYIGNGILSRTKRKTCVYCGKSFTVFDHIIK